MENIICKTTNQPCSECTYSCKSKAEFVGKEINKLVDRWKELNKQALTLLNKHKSFRAYNNVRLQMDKIENKLINQYNYDIYATKSK